METNQTPKPVTEPPLRAVAGTINYTRPIAERLHIDVRDFSRTNMQFEPHNMRIRDARGIQDRLSLDREGFVLREHRSAVAGSRDLSLLTRDYHAEMVRFLKTLTGARDVLPQRTGLLLRFGERSTEQGVKPARFAHLDYTTPWAHQFVELVMRWEQATLRPYRRFAIYQTWRAMRSRSSRLSIPLPPTPSMWRTLRSTTRARRPTPCRGRASRRGLWHFSTSDPRWSRTR